MKSFLRGALVNVALFVFLGTCCGAVFLLSVSAVAFSVYGKTLIEEATTPDHTDLDIVVPEPAAPVPAEIANPLVNWEKRVKQDRVLIYSGGLLLEALANATPAYTPASAFTKQFLKQAGVQLQVAILEDANLISHEPAIAFAQGFLVGL